MKYNKNNKYGFTLVELLAVIVILAIILVIAVPKVMSVIEDSKKATLESTAKMIASAAEKSKVQNTVLGKTEKITCDSVAKINNIDYDACSIDFVDNTAYVNITGKGKFGGLSICKGTKTEAMATNEECEPNGILLPEIGITLEDCTWKQIKAIGEAGKADEYFQLGDTKTIALTDGTSVTMEIVAFNADEKADGSKAAITWISRDIVTTNLMSYTNSNANGWKASKMRAWLQGEFYATLPAEVQEAIVSVNKTYYDKSTGSTLSCEDSVWIPSYREIIGSGYEGSGAVYTGYFTDNASRIKYNSSGSAAEWWLRSAYRTSSTSYCYVNSIGASTSGASYSSGVVPGFCTG